MPAFDGDDWAKDDCDCGHRRHSHRDGGAGGCRRTTMRADYSNLPAAEWADGQDQWLDWPTNWPPAADIPYLEVPCGCERFTDPEPPEPDEDPR